MAQLIKEQLYGTKIWIGANPVLQEAVYGRLEDIGFKQFPIDSSPHSIYINTGGNITWSSADNKTGEFNHNPRFKEIHLWDLGLSSEGEYSEYIGKDITIGKEATCGQSAGSKGIIRDIKSGNYYVHQTGLGKTRSVASPCVLYEPSLVGSWIRYSENPPLPKSEFKKRDGKTGTIIGWIGYKPPVCIIQRDDKEGWCHDSIGHIVNDEGKVIDPGLFDKEHKYWAGTPEELLEQPSFDKEGWEKLDWGKWIPTDSIPIKFPQFQMGVDPIDPLKLILFPEQPPIENCESEINFIPSPKVEHLIDLDD